MRALFPLTSARNVGAKTWQTYNKRLAPITASITVAAQLICYNA